MIARYPITIVDACVLCSPVKRNLLLSFAESGLFQVRWSEEILRESARAIEIIAGKWQHPDASGHAGLAVQLMSDAFAGSTVTGFERFEDSIGQLPDEGDRHVIAAAIKARADVIVTENLQDFPRKILARLEIEPLTTDDFVMDLFGTSPVTASAAVERMRLRLGRPDKSPQVLWQDMKRAGLRKTVAYLNSQ